jgi:hypothetical protein
MPKLHLFGDLKSPVLLHLKGWLFFVLGVVAASLLLYQSLDLRTAALLAICVWAFCRWYYFLFYVIERYAGGERYAGLFDYLKRTALMKRRSFHPLEQRRDALP